MDDDDGNEGDGDGGGGGDRSGNTGDSASIFDTPDATHNDDDDDDDVLTDVVRLPEFAGLSLDGEGATSICISALTDASSPLTPSLICALESS